MASAREILHLWWRSLSPYRRNRVRQRVAVFTRALAWAVAPFGWIRYACSRTRHERLHLGCGAVRLEGWLNTDIRVGAELVVDVALPLPFRRNRFSAIYSEHLVEHLPLWQVDRFLRNAHRVLRPGGVMRIAMPDLSEVVRSYLSPGDDWRDQDWLSWPDHSFIRTRAEAINVAFRWWGHQYLYDAEDLKRRLCDAGFRQIEFCEAGASKHPDLVNLETRGDSFLIAEVTKD